MIKPSFLEPEDRPAILARVFDTPLVVKGWTGLPLIELVAWVILSWIAAIKRPAWSRWNQVYAGALTTALMLGSEWCHNLSHAAVARWVGKPTDAIRIFWGTPLLIYYDINDQTVLPRQHIVRALGGPVFSTLMASLAYLAKRSSKEGTIIRYASDFTFGVNLFTSSLALLPIPGLDGGPLLKWSLVEKGHSPEEADVVVQKVNRFVGFGLASASVLSFTKRKRWLGAALAAFAATSLSIGFGILKEQNKR